MNDESEIYKLLQEIARNTNLTTQQNVETTKFITTSGSNENNAINKEGYEQRR